MRAVRQGVDDEEAMLPLLETAHRNPRAVRRAAHTQRKLHGPGPTMIGEVTARRLEAALAGVGPTPTSADEWSLCREEDALRKRPRPEAFEWLLERIPELAAIGPAEFAEIRADAERDQQGRRSRARKRVFGTAYVEQDWQQSAS